MSKSTVSLKEIEGVTTRALINHGAAENVAIEVAKAVRKAEATGNLICGLYYLESYCIQLRSGRVNGVVEPQVTRPRCAMVKVDAGLGFAQSAFAKALPEAVKVVKEAGTCSLAVCHSHTCTSLGYFTEQIAEAGLVGIGFTDASAIVCQAKVEMSHFHQVRNVLLFIPVVSQNERALSSSKLSDGLPSVCLRPKVSEHPLYR